VLIEVVSLYIDYFISLLSAFVSLWGNKKQYSWFVCAKVPPRQNLLRSKPAPSVFLVVHHI
jgi:hypothetical protein